MAIQVVALLALALVARRTGVVTLAVGAVFLPLIVVGGSLHSETLFVTLLLAAVAVARQVRGSPRPAPWIVAAGVLVGRSVHAGGAASAPLALAGDQLERRPARASTARAASG